MDKKKKKYLYAMVGVFMLTAASAQEQQEQSQSSPSATSISRSYQSQYETGQSQNCMPAWTCSPNDMICAKQKLQETVDCHNKKMKQLEAKAFLGGKN